MHPGFTNQIKGSAKDGVAEALLTLTPVFKYAYPIAATATDQVHTRAPEGVGLLCHLITHRLVQLDAAVPTRELHRTTKSLCNGDKAMTVDIVDSDTHYYEPPDCFTRYIEPRFRDSAITVADPDAGNERVMWRGQQLHLVNPGFFTEALNPGSLKEWFQAIKKGIAPDDARLLARRQALCGPDGISARS